MIVNVPLSKLVFSGSHLRRVKAGPAADRALAASIAAHGLLEPLVVRPENGHYRVVAGDRRLKALRRVHQDGRVKVPCVVREVEQEEAEELGLAENYCRAGMHALDEAERFAKLAGVDRKGVSAIAA